VENYDGSYSVEYNTYTPGNNGYEEYKSAGFTLSRPVVSGADVSYTKFIEGTNQILDVVKPDSLGQYIYGRIKDRATGALNDEVNKYLEYKTGNKLTGWILEEAYEWWKYQEEFQTYKEVQGYVDTASLGNVMEDFDLGYMEFQTGEGTNLIVIYGPESYEKLNAFKELGWPSSTSFMDEAENFEWSFDYILSHPSDFAKLVNNALAYGDPEYTNKLSDILED